MYQRSPAYEHRKIEMLIAPVCFISELSVFVVDGFSSRPMRKSHSSFDAFTAFTCNRFGTKLEHISL
jgi:hypothetical protein